MGRTMMGALSRWLFDPEGLTPHGFCLVWTPSLIWTHALADLLIGLAYFTIPAALIVFARRRQDLVYPPVLWLFVAFILLCGIGHWLDLVTLWWPAYGIQAVVKVGTGLASVGTAITLWKLLPHLLSLPSFAQLSAAGEALAEARRRASFEHSPVPLFILDPALSITDVSNSWLALLGYSHQEVVGQTLRHFEAAGSDPWNPAIGGALEAGEAFEAERQFLHADGRVIDAQVTARRDRLYGSDRLTCVLIDITARKRAEQALHESEEKLRAAQKMEAIGRLAAGVAHDFNNILQSIVGALEMVIDEMPAGSSGRDFSEIAMNAAQRGSSLTHHMLSYARKQMLRPQPVDLESFLRETRKLLERSLGPHIAVSVDVETALCTKVDPGQLQTALLNLAINAAHAMAAGGRLRIEARQVSAEGRNWAGLSVIDTGTGMDKATLSQAMEPFFSTKGVDGSGLGLSMVQGFAEQSGGRLFLSSRLGHGTTVELWLPLAQPRLTGPDPPDRATLRAPPRVLLVDDSADLLASTGAQLERAGCEVMLAGHGDRAMELIAGGFTPDVLVTDYAMAGLNGAQLITEARLLVPNLRSVLISGFAEHNLTERLPPDTLVLHKPFQHQTLMQALTEVMLLDQRPPVL